MTSASIADALGVARIPVPKGVLLDARYRARTNDWYVKTEHGWFWWDVRKQQWLSQKLGPP